MVTTTHCPVLQETVTRVTDFEGHTVDVICPHFEDRSGTCRLKARASRGGPLSRLLERVAEQTLASRDDHCSVAA